MLALWASTTALDAPTLNRQETRRVIDVQSPRLAPPLPCEGGEGDLLLDSMVGRTVGFGRYQLLGLLGRGGMGSVYEAEQLNLRRRVALKVLDPALTRQPDFVQRFHREVETIAHLEHPNILPVYDSGEDDDGMLYLVMLLVRGGTLKDRLHLEPPPWPARQVLKLAQQVLAALDAAHQQGIIHRDIKPDNILLHGERALLADFGIAKLMQGDPGLTVVGTFVGTPDYAAPEQVLALPLDGRSDLYAFGVVLYELLTGRVPYRADTPMGVALQHVQGMLPPPWELNPNLPLPIARVLVRALAREREQRYSTGPELAEALEQAIAESEGTTASGRTGPGGRRKQCRTSTSPRDRTQQRQRQASRALREADGDRPRAVSGRHPRTRATGGRSARARTPGGRDAGTRAPGGGGPRARAPGGRSARALAAGGRSARA